MNRRITFSALAAAVVLCLGASGCGDGIGTYCEREIQCEGGNDRDVEACIKDHEADVKVAEIYECGDMANSVIECEVTHSICVWTGSRTSFSDSGKCTAAWTAAAACVSSREGT